MLLLGLGANPNVKDCNGDGALEYGGVCQSNHTELRERTGEVPDHSTTTVQGHPRSYSLFLVYFPPSFSARGRGTEGGGASGQQISGGKWRVDAPRTCVHVEAERD